MTYAMSTYSVAVIGTGPHPDVDSHDGYSMGYRHADSYVVADGSTLRGCADIVSDNVAAFLEEYDLGADAGYSDHERMLDEIEPDIVSICTPPSTHLDLVSDCARHDAVRAIHCEKPMATTFGETRKMVEVCEESGVQLSINVQNRCSEAATRVRELVESGAIGELERIEFARADLLQTGVHHIDLANFIAGDESIEWVLGQIDYSEEHVWYTGMHAETQGLGLWQYASGVHCFCSTGEGMDVVGNSTNQVIGSKGRIEIDLGHHDVRMRTSDTDGWESIDLGDLAPQDSVIQDVIDVLGTDEEPVANGRVGLAATEVVFSIWESARCRGRISLPLEIDDNPLEQMIEDGDLPPSGEE